MRGLTADEYRVLASADDTEIAPSTAYSLVEYRRLVFAGVMLGPFTGFRVTEMGEKAVRVYRLMMGVSA